MEFTICSSNMKQRHSLHSLALHSILSGMTTTIFRLKQTNKTTSVNIHHRHAFPCLFKELAVTELSKLINITSRDTKWKLCVTLVWTSRMRIKLLNCDGAQHTFSFFFYDKCAVHTNLLPVQYKQKTWKRKAHRFLLASVQIFFYSTFWKHPLPSVPHPYVHTTKIYLHKFKGIWKSVPNTVKVSNPFGLCVMCRNST